MNTAKPELLFYCQHSLGMGHLVRALSLTAALAKYFHVVFLNGGRFPEGLAIPEDLEIINLPPLGMAEDNSLFSQDPDHSVASALETRRDRMLALLAERRPQALLIELFPFGRKKFAGELLPLIRAAKRMGAASPVVLCSLRDIMVGARKDQSRHDERARWLVDRYFDGILVHSDPAFAKLEESFTPRKPLRTPVHYTGFVAPRQGSGTRATDRGVLVSVGGGNVGGDLLRAALAAQRALWEIRRQPMTLVAGPFLPEAEWQALQDAAHGIPGVTLHRSVPALGPLLAEHSVSVSQGGYNTVMDVLAAGIPALIVPFARGQEDEQTNRALRLEKLGLLKVLAAAEVDSARLAAAILETAAFKPGRADYNFAGAEHGATLIRGLAATRFERLSMTDAAAATPNRSTSGNSPELLTEPA